MRRLAVAAAAVVLVPSAAAAPPAGRQFFPLRLGNQWRFEDRRYGVEDALAVSRAVEGVFVLTGFPGAPAVRIRWSGQTLEAWDRKQRRWESFLRLGARAGTTYAVDLPQPLWDGVQVTVASRRASLFNPVLRRRYSSTLRLSIRPSPGLSDAGVTDFWFAPRVGPVRWIERSIAGPGRPLSLSRAGRQQDGRPTLSALPGARLVSPLAMLRVPSGPLRFVA